jgi:hypothetical protein
MDVTDRHSDDGQPSTVHAADEQCAESEPFSQASRSHALIQGQASDTHRPIEAPTAAQSPKRGSTVALDAATSPQIEVQDQGPIDFTLTGLNNLRKQHRYKSAIRRQRGPRLSPA